jgi:uncharacterized protein (DUF1810 family)
LITLCITPYLTISGKLFTTAVDNLPEGQKAYRSERFQFIFLKVLDKFFDGKKDTRTLAILKQIGE